MSDDLHTPTSAAPDPGAAAWRHPGDATPPPPPPPSSSSPPPATPALEEQRPEVLVGAAFAGGLVAAMILKRLGRRG